MPLPLFFADAFTDLPFKGNPAAVVMDPAGLSDLRMQQIATEIGFSETAFLRKASNQVYDIRYFTPRQEIPLCGHATLASAAVLIGEEELANVNFIAGNGSRLEVHRTPRGILMRFPKYPLEPFIAPAPMLESLGISAVSAAAYNPNLKIILLELEQGSLLRQLNPDFAALLKSYEGINGVLVTSVSDEEPYDFVYRYFWPWSGTYEDPVTGGVQTFLAPYWANKLGRNMLQAFQPSERTGKMMVEVDDQEVRITGQVVVTMKGQLMI